MEIKLGAFELQPGFVQVGNLLALAYSWHSDHRWTFKFYRPDAEHDSYFLFWRTLRVEWNGPKVLRRIAAEAEAKQKERLVVLEAELLEEEAEAKAACQYT